MEKKPVLAIIQVGDNQASNSYVKGKIKDCEEVGIRCIVSKLDKDIEEHELLTANLIVARQKELLIGFISMAMTYAVKMLLFLAEAKLLESHL